MMQNDLINRLQQKDSKAIGDLYDAYGAALHGIVLRIVQSPELAQQVLQDTFVKVWRKADGYDPDKGRLFTWLLNIARNTAIDATRSAHFRTARRMQPIESVLHLPGTGLDTNCILVREAVSGLDEKYRSLIDLIYFRDYTHQETAEETGLPLGTVKTRVRAGLAVLRKKFEVSEASNEAAVLSSY